MVVGPESAFPPGLVWPDLSAINSHVALECPGWGEGVGTLEPRVNVRMEEIYLLPFPVYSLVIQLSPWGPLSLPIFWGFAFSRSVAH